MSDTAEPFLSRWSRLKQGGSEELAEETGTETELEAIAEKEEPLLTDEDMPSIESLGDDDDYSGFLNAGISPELRQKALWRLFRSSKFNVTDGLDDYAEDFTSFAPLGDIITSDMKHRMERLLAKEEASESETSSGDGSAEVRATGESQGHGADAAEPESPASEQAPSSIDTTTESEDDDIKH